MIKEEMKIEFIGARGIPVSYASAEDIVRELGPRFVRDGDVFVVHCWFNEESKKNKIKEDFYYGIKRVFHKTPGGKITGQLFVALKSSIKAAISENDIVHYQCLNSTIFSWIPRIFGKKVFINVDGQIWKDPKWPWGIRHIYFNLCAIISLIFGNKIITDSYYMSKYYEKTFKVKLPYIGYGCSKILIKREELDKKYIFPNGYYLIMSRVTPHNLTDIIVDGFISAGSQSHLLIAGHLPDTDWFKNLYERSKNNNVTYLGLIKDQNELNQLILNCKVYLHGHSLGGINSALVRVVGLNRPVICVDTPFNREVVEYPNKKLQAILFQKDSDSVSHSIHTFEKNEEEFIKNAMDLGEKVRNSMSWDSIYEEYKNLYIQTIDKNHRRKK